ncbi:hypothetical protein ACJQWK_06521 [Exserohilum turcicum]
MPREIYARPRLIRSGKNITTYRRVAKLRLPSVSFLSHSQSSFARSTASSRRTDYSVAATDPKQTARLWMSVMSYKTETENSKGEERAKSTTLTSASTSGQRRRQTSATSESSLRTRREIAAKVTDADFMEAVLESYGIMIQNKGVNKDLCKHFRIQELPHDPKRRLDAYKEIFALDSWLEPEIERIQREYKAMRLYGCNEAEHSAYALRDIFLDEPRYPWSTEEDSDQCWLPVRMLQLVRKLPQDEWLAPPLIGLLNKRYEWDIRPDCAYHVSLQAFQPGFRPSVRKHVSVVQMRAFCPYLTIEFKKDDETLATARHQVAVASAMELYNHYRLKNYALHMSGERWSEEDKSQMRHYGITFTGSTWDLWCTVPRTFETWTGCEMSTIYSGDCCIRAGVQKLVSIVNDIHYWGLAIHGRSCKADIAAKIRSDLDADTDHISFS